TNFDRLAQLCRNFRELLESITRAFWVHNVAAEKGAAAIEFKVEIPASRVRLGKEFDATILPNFVEVLRAQTAHIAVLDMKNAMNSQIVVQKTSLCLRPVLTALGAKNLNL